MYGYVYFIGQRGSNTVKIGKTRGPPVMRMAQLQTGNPKVLYLRAYAYLDNYGAAETAIHRKYGRRRIIGEWFDISSRDIWSILGELEDEWGATITPCAMKVCC